MNGNENVWKYLSEKWGIISGFNFRIRGMKAIARKTRTEDIIKFAWNTL